MEALIWEKPEEIDKKLAERVRMVRKRKYITQEELSGLSDVSYGSIKRFESSIIFSNLSSGNGSNISISSFLDSMFSFFISEEMIGFASSFIS